MEFERGVTVLYVDYGAMRWVELCPLAKELSKS